MSKPRYAEIATQLIDDIGSGKLPVGATLPGELELAAMHGVSRATVRAALQKVQALGLISRRKRAGIRVEAARPARTYAPSLSNIDDLMQFAADTERRVVSVRELSCDASLAARLECEPGRRWLRVEMLRVDPRRADTPICWTEVYLDALLGAGLRRELRRHTGLICEMIEQKYGRAVAELRQTIRAIGIAPHLANALAAEPNGHALEIVRHYVDRDGVVFEATISTLPAERFAYSLRLQREQRD